MRGPNPRKTKFISCRWNSHDNSACLSGSARACPLGVRLWNMATARVVFPCAAPLRTGIPGKSVMCWGGPQALVRWQSHWHCLVTLRKGVPTPLLASQSAKYGARYGTWKAGSLVKGMGPSHREWALRTGIGPLAPGMGPSHRVGALRTGSRIGIFWWGFARGFQRHSWHPKPPSME